MDGLVVASFCNLALYKSSCYYCWVNRGHWPLSPLHFLRIATAITNSIPWAGVRIFFRHIKCEILSWPEADVQVTLRRKSNIFFIFNANTNQLPHTTTLKWKKSERQSFHWIYRFDCKSACTCCCFFCMVGEISSLKLVLELGRGLSWLLSWGGETPLKKYCTTRMLNIQKYSKNI